MARFLGALGRFCVRRRRTVFELWAVIMLGAGVLGITHGGMFVQQSTLPGTETQRAIDTLGQDFPAMTGPTATIVFHETAQADPADWRVALTIGRAIDNVGRMDRVAFVENPYVRGMGGLKDDNAVVVRLNFTGTMSDVGHADLDALNRAVEPARMAAWR
ncbi:hypothetical protein [Actinomadura madurae]|uniref:hypothetical protein n=1 Tax=Actinomadura madurae TaxID=1993 RepID=UPI0020D255B7|nr:hypothetical protein [Actinomadura madurae]MCP9967522.1 hypothetical protein [Actinomadura madurae]MCQ0008494.1 hypothetical protein [Actinomadura madurae]MCQ0016189.1 hypothetical protein [Actinomadura madurae]